MLKYALPLMFAFLTPLLVGFLNFSPTSNVDNVEAFKKYLETYQVTEKEKYSRYMMYNFLKFSALPEQERANQKVLLVGSSRTKILRPRVFGNKNVINGGGNSYNEMSYGLLVEMLLYKKFFPNLKKIYVESSILFDRRNKMLVEKNHEKYVWLYKELLPVLKSSSLYKKIRKNLRRKSSGLMDYFISGKIAMTQALFGDESNGNVENQSFYKTIDEYGHEVAPLRMMSESSSRLIQKLTEKNPKISRIKGVVENFPWDGLFDLIAKWGKDQGLEIVFFQPPVSGKFREFQVKYGYELHEEKMNEIVEKYEVLYLNYNTKKNIFSDHPEYFSDEDHMETCMGNFIFLKLLLRNHGYSDVDMNALQSSASKFCFFRK